LAGLGPPANDNDNDDTNVQLVMDTQPNAGATQADRHWTPEEDAKLTSAVTITCKNKHGKKHRIDWVAVAALVPGRTEKHCQRRWHDLSNPSIFLTARRAGKWGEDEDIKLKKAIEMHGDKDWAAVTTLVLGRTKRQSSDRWRDVLDPSINLAIVHKGSWTEDEVIKLKKTIEMHGGKD
jgi:hypothetical protein